MTMSMNNFFLFCFLKYILVTRKIMPWSYTWKSRFFQNYQKAYNVKLQLTDYNNSYILNLKIILGVILKCYLQGAEDGTVGLQLEVIQTAYLE